MNEVPYSQTSFAPAPGTSAGGSWSDFLNTVVRGATQIIQTVKDPAGANGGGYAGTSQPYPAQGQAGGSGLGFLLVLVLVFLVVER